MPRLSVSSRRLRDSGAAALAAAALLFACACSDPIALAWKFPIKAASVSTPLVTKSYIAFGSDVGVQIVEPDGSPRCTFDAHGTVISKPATNGKLIYFGSTNYIFYAIDPTCVEKWKHATHDRIKSDPLVDGNRVYTSSYDGHVYALDAATGKTIWTFPSPPKPVAAAAPDPTPRKRLVGRRRHGRRHAAHPEAAPATPPKPAPPPAPTKVGDFSYSSPVLADGIIYIGNLDHYLYAIHAKDGSFAWRFKTEAPVTSTPLVAGGKVYFGSNDGNIYAVSLSTHRAVWKVTTEDWVNSSPRLVDGMLYIGANDRNIRAIDAQSGEVKWKHPTRGPEIAIPAVYKNLVFGAGGSGDGTIYALQRATGALFWKYPTEGKIESDPVIAGNHLYVTDADHHLYAFTIRRTTAKQ